MTAPAQLQNNPWRFALIVLFVVFTSASSFAQTRRSARPPERIRFTTGAISAQVRGRFTANERVRYVIKAGHGDYMVINIIPVTRGLTMAGTVISPSGHGDGGPGGIISSSLLFENGDYLIEVNQHTMGSNFKSGSFILEVVITRGWMRN